MKNANPAIRGSSFLLFASYLLFVIYGSLLPFDYRPVSVPEAVVQFLHIRYLDLGVVSRADWVANILLYIPLAFLAADWAAGSTGTARHHVSRSFGAIFFAVLLCIGTAVAIEFTQIFFSPRTVSLNDLLAEGIGTGIGIFLWTRYRTRLRRLIEDFRQADERSLHAAIALYLIAYLTLALFPFDLLISTSEWHDKLSSARVAWILADNCGGPRCIAQLAAEAAAIAPLGLLLALANPHVRLARLAAFGLLFGVVLELLQLTIASGTSQGISAGLRALGLALGAWAGRRIHGVSLHTIAKAVYRLALVLFLPYLIALAWFNGWGQQRWLTAGEAFARLPELKFLPLYYHYFSTETHAVASALSQIAMYSPLGILYWARRYRRHHPRPLHIFPLALLAGSLSLLIELGKLAIASRHPDLSNPFFAIAGAMLSCTALEWLSRVITGHSQEPPAPAAPDPEIHRERGQQAVLPPPQAWPVIGLLAITVLGGLAYHPFGPWFLGLLLIGYALLLWRHPWAWLLAIPAALPVIDFSPVAGRQLIDVFDLVVTTSLLIGYWRLSPLRTRSWPRHLLALAYLVLCASWVLAFLLGMQPYGETGESGLTSSHSPLEAWMTGKGLLWALLAVPLFRRVPKEETPHAQRLLLYGLFIGLALEVGYILAERHVFSGLLDFASVYRVTGTFASMHTGGAYIEAFLALAFPAAIFVLKNDARRWARLLAIAVMAAGIYGMAVTFSRGGYAGLALAVTVTLLAMAVGERRLGLHLGRTVLWASILIVAFGLTIFSSDFARHRLSQSGKDLDLRLAHWSEALELMQHPVHAPFVGKGFGSYPRSYLEAARPADLPATFALTEQDGKRFLRLTAGRPLYLDQVVSIAPYQTYELSVEARFPFGEGELSVPVCEKDLLYSFDCHWLRFPAARGVNEWQQFTTRFDSRTLGAGGGWPHRPVRLSLYNSASLAPVDIAVVRLTDSDGRELLHNGGFTQGLDRWLYVTDLDPAWHIDQQALETYFAQGLPGLLGVSLLLLGAARVLRRGILAGCKHAPVFLGALAGFLTVGLVGSTVDTARSAMLFYFVAFAAALITEKGRRHRIGLSRRGTRSSD